MCDHGFTSQSAELSRISEAGSHECADEEYNYGCKSGGANTSKTHGLKGLDSRDLMPYKESNEGFFTRSNLPAAEKTKIYASALPSTYVSVNQKHLK